MTIAYPYFLTQGKDPAFGPIGNLSENTAWLARSLEEINVDLQMNRKKLSQWLMNACNQYRLAFADLQDRIAREGVSQDGDWPRVRVAGEILAMTQCALGFNNKMFWPSATAMRTDLITLNNAALTIRQWVIANIPDWETAPFEVPEMRKTPDGTLYQTMVPVVVTFPANLKAQIGNMRAIFGAVPA